MDIEYLASDLVQRLTDASPYRWQARLLHDHFLKGSVPAALDIPTGLGKTRAMALWLVARALGAKLPRRLVYVVDRRAVVDQASEEAARLAKNLPRALEGLDAALAEQCRENLGLIDDNLPVSTLRGRLADNRRWLDNPGGAAIIVGTVDMIGSRLLFEGYGVSPGMRPVHAGLLGTDSLVLIDEAHLAQPFQALLETVAGAERPEPVPMMRVMALSATGPSPGEGKTVFDLEPRDREDLPVHARLEAPKWLALHEADDLVEAMTERALELGEGGRRVIVFCNQRDRGAREIEERLRKRLAKTWKGAETTALLTGARRGLERALDPSHPSYAVVGRFLSGVDPAAGGAPAFLVATSAGEVGVDLDADHMVCDLVAWERMVQRLGRVNRGGRPEPAMVEVFWSPALSKAVKADQEDEVEDRLATLRVSFESRAWVELDGRRAAGPGALLALKRDKDFIACAEAATTPAPLRPELSPPLVEAWAMTSLADHPGRPRIEPWLRGWIEVRPQAQLTWRTLLPVRAEQPDNDLLEAFFTALPPHADEVLESDVGLVAGLLKARAAETRKRVKGEERRALQTLAAVVLTPRNAVAARYGLDGLAEIEIRRLEAQLAGCTVVLDRRLGGLSPQGLLDPKTTEPPRTLDAEASEPADLRWPESGLKTVGRRLRRVELDRSDEADPQWVRLDGWSLTDDEDATHEWRVERLAKDPELGDAARASKSQILEQHHVWTRDEAVRIGRVLNLSDAQVSMLALAAGVHDAGKARDLWQTAMGAEPSGRPYAKTTGVRANPALMQGFRHEFGSLRTAEAALSAIEDEDLRDLAHHLVVAHHGHARPLIHPFDPEAPPSASEARARDAALRFARLQRRWGPWGLAWWEALLRAADWAASRRNEGEGADG